MSRDRFWMIVFNFVGRVGKSSTIRTLQAIAASPFLHMSTDAFIGMLPERLFGHPDGLVFEPGLSGGHPCITVRIGLVMAQAMRGMRDAVLAAQGNDLLVDNVMFDPAEAAEYRALLTPREPSVVGLFAPLDVVEERERERGDRVIGLARGYVDRVHRGIAYDLEIDAVRHNAGRRAAIVCKAFGSSRGTVPCRRSRTAFCASRRKAVCAQVCGFDAVEAAGEHPLATAILPRRPSVRLPHVRHKRTFCGRRASSGGLN